MTKLNPNIDYGKALKQMTENPFPVNPALIHKIQDGLIALPGESLLAIAYRNHAKENIQSCIDRIIFDYPDNPRIIIEVVGKEILDWIEEYKGITLADDLDYLFGGLID